MKKAPYHRPELKRLGSFESLTQHTSTGHKLDQSFQAGTLLSAILDHGLS